MFQGLATNYERYMSLLTERQKLVASNIANADTPGYRTKDIDFQAEFENAIERQARRRVIEPQNLPAKTDGNNVNLDREARLLSENAMRFQIATNFARSDLADIKMAIQDGKYMNLLSALSVSASGMAAQRQRTELLVENLANSDTTRTPEGGPYRRKDVVFAADPNAVEFLVVVRQPDE